MPVYPGAFPDPFYLPFTFETIANILRSFETKRLPTSRSRCDLKKQPVPISPSLPLVGCTMRLRHRVRFVLG
jgi:hypothetical protein